MRKYITVLLCMMCTIASAQHRLSNNGRKFIQNVEKCSLIRYRDNGAWAIGYGHRMTHGKKQYVKINKQTAVRLLNEDLRKAERIANHIIDNMHWTPSQSFFDGLVSIVYNCGCMGVYKSEFYRRLMQCRSVNGKVNKSDLTYTVAAVKTTRIPSGKYADGVKARRYAEHKMMLK